MQVLIFAITISPSTTGDLHRKFAPTLGLLHPNFCPGRFVGVGPEEGHFWNFIMLQELETDNTSGFICCSESLYVFEEKYSNLD